jgi:hypothetical protein
MPSWRGAQLKHRDNFTFTFINSIWNKEELPQQWKESTVVPIYKKGNKTDCSHYSGTLMLPTNTKFLSNILPSRLTPYIDELVEIINADSDVKKNH